MINTKYIALLILPLATTWQVSKAEEAQPQEIVWPQTVVPAIVTEE